MFALAMFLISSSMAMVRFLTYHQDSSGLSFVTTFRDADIGPQTIQ